MIPGILDTDVASGQDGHEPNDCRVDLQRKTKYEMSFELTFRKPLSEVAQLIEIIKSWVKKYLCCHYTYMSYSNY